jgi:hypothetical protein
MLASKTGTGGAMDTNREGHSDDDEFPPLQNEDVADDTDPSGLTVGELVDLAGDRPLGLASIAPALASAPDLDWDRLSRPLASRRSMAELGTYGDMAEDRADRATDRSGPDSLTDAIGEGLAAVAYALLEVAMAIRENTEARQ